VPHVVLASARQLILAEPDAAIARTEGRLFLAGRARSKSYV
jgi:hypothetical protein